MTPEETLKRVKHYLEQLEEAKRRIVKVGLPEDKVSGVAHGDDGATITEIGAFHEYGTAKMEARSFLRMPFDLKCKELEDFKQKEFRKVLEQGDFTIKALGRLGVFARNISVMAFRNNGYGQWAPLAESTQQIKAEAGKTTPLIWSGLLRGSITWSVK